MWQHTVHSNTSRPQLHHHWYHKKNQTNLSSLTKNKECTQTQNKREHTPRAHSLPPTPSPQCPLSNQPRHRWGTPHPNLTEPITIKKPHQLWKRQRTLNCNPNLNPKKEAGGEGGRRRRWQVEKETEGEGGRWRRQAEKEAGGEGGRSLITNNSQQKKQRASH